MTRYTPLAPLALAAAPSLSSDALPVASNGPNRVVALGVALLTFELYIAGFARRFCISALYLLQALHAAGLTAGGGDCGDIRGLDVTAATLPIPHDSRPGALPPACILALTAAPSPSFGCVTSHCQWAQRGLYRWTRIAVNF